MPASVELRENGRVLYYVFTEPWTLDDMRAVTRKARPLYDAARTKVHVLFDARGMSSLPSGLLTARNNPDVRHPNSGHIAMVGASPLVHMIAETITRISRFNRIKFFQTEDEAWAYLRQVIADEDANQGGARPGTSTHPTTP